MSAWGQQRSSKNVSALSAITPIAARKRTFRYFAFVLTRDNRLLDHLVGLYKKRLRQAKAESFCGFQVDYHFEFGRQLNWKFVCLRSSEYAVHIGCRPTKQIAKSMP